MFQKELQLCGWKHFNQNEAKILITQNFEHICSNETQFKLLPKGNMVVP
jgi:hypothetical protein